MKQFKSLFVIFVTLLLCFAGCQDPALEEVKVSLDKSAVSIAKGETIKLSPVVSPSGAAPVLKWSSSDKKVASVTDEGFVSGLAAGEAVITVTADKSSASCKVTVRPVEVESITLDKETAEMLIGDKLSLKATVLPADADNAAVTWTSLNDKVASVDQNGNVTALAEGNATIVAKAGDVEPAQCAITVSAPVVNVESVTISECPETMVEGDTFQLKAEVKPDNATDKSVIWTSENEEVLTIDDNGLATAVEAGEVRITVTSVDGEKTDWCMVMVEPKVYHVEKVTIESVPEGNVMLQGETFKFSAKVSPDNASDKSVEWTSSDEEVLSIDQEGNALAVKEGTVTVTVTSVDGGKTASCEITVERINVTGVEISVKPENDKMVEGSEFRFEAIVLPENASIKDVEWSSSDEEVLSVDETGNAKALKAGVATLAVKTVDGDFTAECEITVEPNIIPVQSVSIKESPADNKMLVDDVFTFEAVITPEDASDKNVTWTSSDPEVIKIDADGKAVTLKPGNARITVTTADGGKTASTDDITVEIRPIPVESVKITDYAETIKVGSDFQFNAEVTPADATDKSVTWISENEEVLTIDENGLATGVEEGTVIVRVTTTDGGKTDECTVVVTAADIHVESVAIENVPDTIKVGDEFVLEAVITPENATDTTVTWLSSSSDVIDIDESGKARALKSGTSTISVTTRDGEKTASVELEVIQPVESVKITSAPSNNKMVINSSFQFSAEVSPDTATDKELRWTSSNPAVLTIDGEGKAKAVGLGTSKVTVITNDGNKTDEVTITVVNPEPISGVFLSSPKGIRHGKTCQLAPEYVPGGAYPKEVRWISSDPALATVDANGLVKAVSFDYTKSHAYYRDNGYPQVTVTVQADGYVASCSIEIWPAAPEKILVQNPPKAYMTVGDTWDMGKITILPAEAEQSVSIIGTMNEKFYGDLGTVFTPDEVGVFSIIIQPNGDHAQVAGSESNTQVYIPKLTYNINIQPILDKSITLSRSSYTTEAGNVFSFTHEILPENTTYKDLRWVSTNEDVATVSDGVVYTKAPGKTTIKAITYTTKYAACELTVTSRKSTAKVGDYYYSDGSTSSQLLSGKTPVGVVFALADAVGSDPASMEKDHPECKHGLVVGLETYSTSLSDDMYASVDRADIAEFAHGAGMIDMEDSRSICGYSNTKAFRTWGDTWSFLDKVNAATSSYSLPSETSGWYLPSIAEIEMLADVYDVVNQKLAALGENKAIADTDEFWTSTYYGIAANSYTYLISEGDFAYKVHQGVATGGAVVSQVKSARFIFAF